MRHETIRVVDFISIYHTSYFIILYPRSQTLYILSTGLNPSSLIPLLSTCLADS